MKNIRGVQNITNNKKRGIGETTINARSQLGRNQVKRRRVEEEEEKKGITYSALQKQSIRAKNFVD